ncbi:cytochrome b/b6 domain-containing protein [Deefgea tanakiae]|uniref:Cytochrome b/b6 domain-containing protein n=1 Tax=Deefgea tanakiae TaxID=2865840 RepID=A0ABX8Z3Z5_9NEIS|nr:cytochrome b/b6 domain-containing protein [Deefgea tanakiae]QZA77304.1 cytochrome b/b6 domain-containing protein [Deefgea tanakiae]
MNQIKVWDPMVRLLHWGLAIAVLGNFINEEGDWLHRWEGYAALAIVGSRIIWGFIGSKHARFSDWFPTPSRVFNYVRAQLRGEHPRYLGHNPAGAIMMLFLLCMVIAMGTTGYMMGTDAFFGEEWLEELHEILAYTLLAGVGLHVAAAIFESWRHKENLPVAMLHGYKRANEYPKDIDLNAHSVSDHS